MSHILECIPPTVRDLERRQISQVIAIFRSPTENVHRVTNNRCRMTFARTRDITNAFED